MFAGSGLIKSGFDRDAKRYIDAVEKADGAKLELEVRRAINSFVVGCKSDGIWDAIKASCILSGARTLTGALTPLAGVAPTNFNFVNGDYNRKTGLIGNGSTKYLNSNRANNGDPRNNAHLSCYISTITPSSGSYIGGLHGTSGVGLSGIFRNANLGLILQTRGVSNNIPLVPSHLTGGFKGTSRNSDNSIIRRFDGTTTTSAYNATETDANPYYVFALRNTDGSAIVYGSGRISFYSIGESLDLSKLDTRVTTLIDAFNTYIP